MLLHLPADPTHHLLLSDTDATAGLQVAASGVARLRQARTFLCSRLEGSDE